MGSRGPIPNRSDDLARDRSRKGGDTGPEVKVGQMRPVRIPEADPDWHDIAVMIWDSLMESGQADFFQQSDWAYAYSLCDDVSHYKSAGRVNKHTGEFEAYRSPEMLKAIQSAMASLLMTEGERRRARVELTQIEPEKTSAAVLAIAQYQEDLGITTE